MRWVGEHYQSGKYFISGLIMAGEIFREAMVALGPLLPPETESAAQGTVLMATVRGDIHDLGKNIVIMMLRSYGILVHDLGVDVAPDEVVRKAEELRPDIIGLSGLLTVATDGMKATVDAVHGAEKQLGRRVPVIIGGGIVDEQTSSWTGADLWTNDASRGVRAHPRGDRRRARLTGPSSLPYGSQTVCRTGRHTMKGPVLTGGVT